MIFNSYEFFFFFLVVFCLHWFVFNRTVKTQNLLILAASYVFYAWWDYRFTGLLLFSTLLDYGFGFLIHRSLGRSRQYLLWLGIAVNLLILGIFKYFNFFAVSFASLLAKFGFHVDPFLVSVILPIGISFYTFHGMSYLLDIYRQNFKPVKSFIDYAVFVSFFPLLVAGPIERATHLLPQVQQKREFNYLQASQGCKLILWGLFKKIVVADVLAKLVDPAFTDPSSYSGTSLIWCAVLFAFQIYADFSGYSDIAIGTAKLLGIELLTNFNRPFSATSITEFWRRWHISLSSFFNDYLFTPLTIRFRNLGNSGIALSLLVTFFLCGLWHGAGWGFIIYGLLHGIAMVFEFLTKKRRKRLSKKIPSFPYITISILFTFLFVCFSWVFFRSVDLTAALNYFSRIGKDIAANPSGILKLPTGISGIAVIIPLLLIDWHVRRDVRDITFRVPVWVRYSLYLGMSLFIMIFFLKSPGTQFIYFQF